MSRPNPDGSDPGHVPESEINAQRQAALAQLLDSQARMRLGNIRMVRPELAAMVGDYLIGMASQGKLGSQVSDAQLKQILQSMQQPRRDFKINRL